MATNYNATFGGNGGAFGTNVAQIGTPPSIYQQLQQSVPNYSALTKTATGDIGSELSGQISPGLQNNLQDKAAAFGVSSGAGGFGQPGSFSSNNFLANLGLTSEGLTHQGLTDYNTFTGTAGSQQSDPNLLFGVASQNALDAAAPNPEAANNYAQILFQKYLQNPSGATGGTGSYPNVLTAGGLEPEPVM